MNAANVPATPAPRPEPNFFGITPMRVHNYYKKGFDQRSEWLRLAMDGGRAPDSQNGVKRLLVPLVRSPATSHNVGDTVFLAMETAGFGVATAVSWPASKAVAMGVGVAQVVGPPVLKVLAAPVAGVAAVLWGNAHRCAAAGPRAAAATAYREVSNWLERVNGAVGGVVASVLVGLGEFVSFNAALAASLFFLFGHHILSNLAFAAAFGGTLFDLSRYLISRPAAA